MHQAALTLWSSLNNGFEALVLLNDISFNNSDRVVFSSIASIVSLVTFTFPNVVFKLEESTKDIVDTYFCKFVLKSPWGEKPKKAPRDGLKYEHRDSNQVVFQRATEKKMHK